jgi:hypothetical protein
MSAETETENTGDSTGLAWQVKVVVAAEIVAVVVALAVAAVLAWQAWGWVRSAGVPWWAIVLVLAYPAGFVRRMWPERRRPVIALERLHAELTDWFEGGRYAPLSRGRRRQAADRLELPRAGGTDGDG